MNQSELKSNTYLHSGQTYDACAVHAIILQKKTIQPNVESFTLTAKRNAVSENLGFLVWACVQNEVTGIHKFYRREIWFIGTFYALFSYELRARKSLNWFKLQGSEKPEVTLLFAFDRCEIHTSEGKLMPGSSQRSNIRRVRSSRHELAEKKTGIL